MTTRPMQQLVERRREREHREEHRVEVARVVVALDAATRAHVGGATVESGDGRRHRADHVGTVDVTEHCGGNASGTLH